MKQQITYYPKANTVHLPIKSTEVYPKYLYYVFEYLKIPHNAKLKFTDKTIKGGIEEWLKE